MKRCPLTRFPRSIRQVVGWAMLLAYVAVFSPAGLGMAAALGLMDSNHQLGFSGSDTGLRVVLHHRCHCGVHHHGLIARTLTAFARPPSPTDPDHVLQFNSGNALIKRGEITSFDSNSDLSLPIQIAASVLSGAEIPGLSKPFHPPPLDGAPLCRRSTVLLI